MTHRRGGTRHRDGVKALSIGATLAALTYVAYVYQIWATSRDHRQLSPPGQSVEAGGHRLHILVTGQEWDGPTVVLEAGGMATSPQWALLQPGIAQFARVVSYDRAGLGWSETGPLPRDADTIARELHAALHNAGLPKPYVLVAASLGGPYATVFADTYRDETAALVLVDSVHPEQMQRLPRRATQALALLRLSNRVLPLLAQLGFTHLVDVTGLLMAGLPSMLPGPADAQLRAFAHWPSHWAAVDAEISAWDNTMEQMRRAMRRGTLNDLPMVVLTAPDNPGMEAMREPWLAMQNDLASISRVTKHHVVEGAGHIAMVTEPGPIHEVIQAVRESVQPDTP